MKDKVFTEFSSQLSSEFDNKLKEACLLWGVDINNHEEVRRRCAIVHRDWSDLREVQIDNKVVMYFTDWKIEEQDINKPFTIKANFKCSEIIKPY